ncbi:MAG TPA: histidinol-phosphate transaminase [Phycisphaerae bacterium]|nr:histidinol-phosphate transaminase [Phycisphaerae bacterium]
MGLVRDNIASMKGYTPGEQPGDLSVIKLNTNENPYPPSPRVLEAVRSIADEQLRRYPNPDAQMFRQAAAGVHGVDADWIMTTNGGDELLALVFRACVGEGQAAAFLDPSYSLYPILGAMQAAKQIVLPYQISGANWELPREIFKLSARLLLIVNPNAPSGTFIDRETLSRIIGGFTGVVLIDEAYVDFAPDNALALVKKHANLILLRSLSKGYSLAGLRFGYGIAQPELLRELNKVRDSYPCDVVAIAAATAAIKDQDWARKSWEAVRSEREMVCAQLGEWGFVIPPSSANFILAQTPEGLSAGKLYEQLKARNILVRWFNLPRLTDKLRITIGTPEQNRALLTAIRELVAQPATAKNG